MHELIDQRPDQSRALISAEGGSPTTLPPPVPVEQLLEAQVQAPPVGRIARMAMLTLGLTLVPFFGWATMTRMEQSVIATGQLIPEGRRKTVNLLEPGILRHLLVQEGSVVAEGQPLLQLDVTQAEATADQARTQYWGGRARMARLRAEQAEQRSFTFPEDVQRAAVDYPAVLNLLEAEKSLFAARWNTYDGQVAVQERAISQVQEQIAGVRGQRQAAEIQVRSTREQIAGLSRLLQQGFASRFTVLELQRTEASFSSAIQTALAQEGQLREQVAQAERQLATIRLTRLSDIATDLQTTEASTASALASLRAAQDILNRREVLAPEAGKITNIQTFTPGASIAAGQPILDIVPLRDRFVVEAQVLPTDIEQVVVGQRVNVRLTSYRMREMPVIPGHVIHVAADAQQNPQGVSYFVLRAEMDQAMLDRLPELRMNAGMPTEVYVLGERRTPLSYLWSPLRNSARRAFRD
ncbi:HlyD family type I secretion periplasmic adaptor subunit [Siccirubricoccus sp. KC 17139]|uniref:Membrane fusion protein (MFP) family protein n=1 Tax=Siccirubricoccus soli TaxID=2899147 RepID=A0ABT1D5H5_9PROT|nr:HlyD family type I secretion periplasmic adaptor subunit [Siccirubricoccus soli]MCO6417178.1 HlyD family type I secretion periplasmic adaptor subunit [Siccirubricoccus soli]MCP2683313.1 HlyD family type I secretion periplasmic adaptor subunit [Siccirubricoccus soli]